MDSIDKSALYIYYAFSRNILARLDAVYSTFSNGKNLAKMGGDVYVIFTGKQKRADIYCNYLTILHF